MSDEDLNLEKARRKRRALLQHYGINENKEKKQGDEDNINSGAFNAQKYVHKLLKEKHLEEVVAIDNKFNEEIRSLDTELQMLVYENYNKFIDATETIKQMKTQVNSMEEEMKNLSQAMETITKNSNSINTNLSEKREKIEKLSTVNRMLKKLQFLLDLPSRLNRSLELKTYSQAVKYYTTAESILQQYSHLPSFKNIQQESMEVMNRMKVTLKEVMFQPGATFKQIEENSFLLIQLKEPVGSLRKEFLEVGKAPLVSFLQQYKPTEKTIKENLVKLQQNFLPQLLDVAKSFNTVFMSENALKEEVEEHKQHFNEWNREVFTTYFNTVKEILVEFYKPTPTTTSQSKKEKTEKLESATKDLKKSLETFHADMIVVNNQVQAKLMDKTSNIISDSIRRYLIQNISVLLKGVVEKEIENIARQKSGSGNRSELKQSCAKLCEIILENTELICVHFKSLFEIYAKEKSAEQKLNVLKTLIKTYMLEAFQSMVSKLSSMYYLHSNFVVFDSEKKPDTTPTGALVLAKLCVLLNQRVASKVEDMLENMFEVEELRRSYTTGIKPIFDAEEIQVMMDDAKQNLVAYYIELQGATLSKLIRTGIETPNWLTMEVPKEVRHMIKLLVTEVETINEELGDIFKDSASKSDTGSESSVSTSALSYGNTSLSYNPTGYDGLDMSSQSKMAKNVMNMFDRKLASFQIKAPQVISRSSILCEIFRASMKTFQECVRACTFQTNGFQQLQVDVQFLKLSWNTLVDDENFVSTLLHEVLSSAAERCLEPIPLELSIVEAICNKSLNNTSS